MKTLNKLTLAISAVIAYLFQTGKHTAYNPFTTPIQANKLSGSMPTASALANRNTITILKGQFFIVYFNLIELLYILYK